MPNSPQGSFSNAETKNKKMEDDFFNDKTDENIETPKKNTSNFKWVKRFGVVIILIAASGFAYYMIYGEIPYTKGVFTEYKPLPYDTSGLLIPVDVPPIDTVTLDSILMNADEMGADSSYVASEKAKTDTVNRQEDNHASASENFFKVNTNYEEIDTNTTNVVAIIPKSNKDPEYLFTEMLLPTESDKMAIRNIIRPNDQSFISLLKVLAFLGQDILTKKNVNTSAAMIDAIAESSDIDRIDVFDRKGNRKYSTAENPEQFSGTIKIANSPKIIIESVNDQNCVFLPIFHVYGQIGYLVIIMK
jgi:hypothetical protein